MKHAAFFCMVVSSFLVIGAQAQAQTARSTPPPMTWQVYTSWPFDATEALRRQTETAAGTMLPTTFTVHLNGPGGPVIDFRLIPASTFMMGSPDTESGHEGDEELHSETISDPYYMMETQLTVEQYEALMHVAPGDVGSVPDPKNPAGVYFHDAIDNVNPAVIPALAHYIPVGLKIILPDRARMEFAARAGVATMTPGGDTPASGANYVWSNENSGGRVHPVAQKLPNAFGLYDVIGNRWHWFWYGLNGNYRYNSPDYHAVYGGAYDQDIGGNGTRLANIMISQDAVGVRCALLLDQTPLPNEEFDFSDQAPSAPVNTSPGDGATDVPLAPTLQASAFNDPNAGDTQGASQWQVRAATSPSDWSVTTFDSGTTSAALTSVLVPDGCLGGGTAYTWRVRYQDCRNAWSNWSTETTLTTIPGPPANHPPDTPANVSPVEAATMVAIPVTLTASAFSDPDVGDSQTASEWEVRPSASPSWTVGLAYDSVTSTSLNNCTVPRGLLARGACYDWRVRYRDSSNAWSSWSADTTFTTIVTPPPAAWTVR